MINTRKVRERKRTQTGLDSPKWYQREVRLTGFSAVSAAMRVNEVRGTA